MRKLIFLLLLVSSQFVNAQIVNDWYDSTSFQGGVSVNSNLRIPTGASNGYVLTSNGTGLATWQTIGSAGVDTIWRLVGKDSIFFKIGAVQYSIKDSVGGGAVDTLTLPFYHSIATVDDTTFTIDKLTGVVDTVRIARGTVGVPTIYAIRTTSTAKSFTANDFMIKTITNSFSVTLPTAVGITGQIYRLKNRGAGTVITLLTTSSQTIDDFASGAFQLDYGDEFGFMSDGSNWLLK